MFQLNRNRIFILLLASVISFGTFTSQARAIAIAGDTAASTSGLGDFTGTMTYSFTSATEAQLIIELMNTSPELNGGFITAFVFNNPGDLIDSVVFSSSDADFQLLGGPGFDDGVNGAPYGQFDVGSSTGSGFEGGGSPNVGIGVNSSAIFTFAFGGSMLDTLSELSFLLALSEGTGAGEGYEGLVVRFRGFEDGGSDKVPGAEVPEPATAVLLGLSLLGAARVRQRRA